MNLRFEIKAAIPFIKLTIIKLKNARDEGSIDDAREKGYSSYKNLLWACCLSLAHLIQEDAETWLSLFWEEYPEYKNKPGVIYGTGDVILS
ncbi:MAG: hypothetical protein ABI904_07535 [Chloroflexota bacterium]